MEKEVEGRIHTLKLVDDDDDGKEQQKNQTTITSRYVDRYILFNILSRVPADVLWNNLRFQSKQWSNLISDQTFINANLDQSKPGIIFMESDAHLRTFTMHFMELKGAEVVGIRVLQDFKKHHVVIRSSCNGLVLAQEGCHSYMVMNPITKKYITLPSARAPVAWSELVFIPSIMEYRVVILYSLHYTNYVLRVMSLDGLYRDLQVPVDYDDVLSWSHPISIIGVVYSAAVIVRKNGNHKVMAFDICNETFLTLWLETPSNQRFSLDLVNLAGSLCLVEFYLDHSYDVSARSLKDMIEGEKLFSFKIDQLRTGNNKYYPRNVVGAINQGGWFMFFEDNNHRLGAYDVKTGEWSLFNYGHYFCYQIHFNSLFFPNHKLEEEGR